MKKVVNLNQYRKQKARDTKRAAADENAARHGRTKAERQLEEARAQKARDTLEGHRRDEPGTEG